MKKALFVYFLFGWAAVLSALSLVMGSTEVLLMFLILAGFLFVFSMGRSARPKPQNNAALLEQYRARRIQNLSSKSVHGKVNPSQQVNVHR